MLITEQEEIDVVLKHRAHKAEMKALQDKRANCEHDWIDRGYCRGETFYQCFKCGSTKWED